MIIIIFGLSGSGKNFIGNILAEEFKFYFWDADNILPQEMLESINKKQIFTQEMRDHFVEAMIENIHNLKLKHKNIVITQALYKERNRIQLKSAFPDAVLVWAKADLDIIMQRFQKYTATIDADYAKKISSQFEKPLLTHQILLNNSDKDSLRIQINSLIDKFKNNN